MKAIRIVEVTYPNGRKYVFCEHVHGGQRNEPASPGCRITEYGFVRGADEVHEFMEPVKTWQDNNGYK